MDNIQKAIFLLLATVGVMAMILEAVDDVVVTEPSEQNSAPDPAGPKPPPPPESDAPSPEPAAGEEEVIDEEDLADFGEPVVDPSPDVDVAKNRDVPVDDIKDDPAPSPASAASDNSNAPSQTLYRDRNGNFTTERPVN